MEARRGCHTEDRMPNQCIGFLYQGHTHPIEHDNLYSIKDCKICLHLLMSMTNTEHIPQLEKIAEAVLLLMCEASRR